MKKLFLNLVLATCILGAFATPSDAQKAPSSKLEAVKIVQNKKPVKKQENKVVVSKPPVKKVEPYHTCTQVTEPKPDDSGNVGIFRRRPPGPGG
jgi:hypothetical protein